LIHTREYVRALLSICLLCVCPAAANAEFLFNPKVDYEVPPDPSDIVIRDVTYDGIPDLLAAHATGHDSLTVFRGIGDGSFVRWYSSAITGGHLGLLLGNFNSDPWLDLALPSPYLGYVGIGLGDSLGAFGALTFEPLPLSPVNSSKGAMGLLNEDQHLDLVVPSGYTDPGFLYILLGNGDGTFQPYASVPTSRGPRAVAVDEFTGDDVADIIVAANYCCDPGDEGGVSIHVGVGDGTFEPKVDIPSCVSPDGLAIGRINGDAYLDVAALCAEGFVNVLTGVGDGSFQTEQSLTIPKPGFGSLVLAHLDAFGGPDIAVTSASTADDDSVTIFPGIGNGNFGPYARFDVDDRPYGIAAADLNGDGHQDLVTSNGIYSGFSSPGSFSVLLRSGTTAISAALEEASVRDGIVRLRWIVSSSGTQAAVYRRTAETGWEYLGLAVNEPGTYVSYEDPSVEPGIRYAYRIQVHSAGDQGYSNEVWVYVPADASAPLTLRLDPVFPNPLEREGRFNFAVPKAGRVRLEIFSVAGQRVATVVNQELPAGWRLLSWDGRDTAGEPVASGTYFARLEASGEAKIRKVVVAR
jgi:FlgD Ig-like domain/FG-GAP-like repeat